MKNARYDPVDMAMSLRASNVDVATDQSNEPSTASGASASTTVEVARSGPVAAARRSSKVQMNLNVEPSTKQLLRELWKPVAAEHTQGEIIDLLVAKWGSDAVAHLIEADQTTS